MGGTAFTPVNPKTPDELLDFYEGRLSGGWAADAMEGTRADDLLTTVLEDFSAVRHLRNRFAIDSRRRRDAWWLCAWQSALLSMLYLRGGARNEAQVRRWANTAKQLGYQCGNLHVVAQAYDREAVFELWYGDPQQAVVLATRGLYVIRNETSSSTSAMLQIHLMRAHATMGNFEAFTVAERAVMASVEKLSFVARPTAFALAPEEVWNARAMCHSVLKSPDALPLYACAEELVRRQPHAVHLHRLQHINHLHALAPMCPHTAASGTLKVLHSTNGPAEQVYLDRAALVLSALPEKYTAVEKTELAHLIQPGVSPRGKEGA